MNVVILGGGYAGITAAVRLARRSRGEARVTLISAAARFVERIRLHERAAGSGSSGRTLASLVSGSGVRLVVGRALAVDESARTVTIGTLEDTNAVVEARLSWDRLVLALGSRPDVGFPGVREHAFVLDHAGAEALGARLRDLSARAIPTGVRPRVLVVGGGLTGLEVAAEIAEARPELHVCLMTRGELGASFSVAARRHFHEALARLDVGVQTHVSAVRVEEGRVVTREGNVPFDVCIWTGGFVGAPLPAGLSLATNANGQVLVDPYLRAVSDPAVYVAGDLAAHAVEPPIPVPMGCKSAGPGGAHVADNLVSELANRPLAPFDFAAPLYCVSLGRKDGVVQRTRADGSLTGPILRGRLAAFVKELICKGTVTAFTLERFGLSRYEMFRKGNVPALGTSVPRAALGAPEAERDMLAGQAVGS